MVVLKGQLENPTPTLGRALTAYAKSPPTPVGAIHAARPLPQAQLRLSAEQVAKLVERYQSGATTYVLAADFGIHRTTVSQHLRAAGVRLRVRPLSDEQEARAVELYHAGLSLTKVGQCLGCDAETIRKVLKRQGVARRDPHAPRPPA